MTAQTERSRGSSGERSRVDELTKGTGLDPLHGRCRTGVGQGDPRRLLARNLAAARGDCEAQDGRDQGETARHVSARRVMPLIVSDVRHTGIGLGPSAGSR